MSLSILRKLLGSIVSTGVLDEPRVNTQAANYKVGEGHTVLLRGIMYTSPDVLPEWLANFDGQLQGRMARGALVATSAPVNRNVPPPVAKTETDPAPNLAIDVLRLERENAQLAQSNRELAAHAKEVQAQSDGRIKALAEQTDQIAHWRKVAEAAEAKVRELEKQIETLTAPKADPVKETLAAGLPKPNPKK